MITEGRRIICDDVNSVISVDRTKGRLPCVTIVELLIIKIRSPISAMQNSCLKTHGFYLSMRQLKRILQSRGLGRRINRSDLQKVSRCIEMELRGRGSTIGYRQMSSVGAYSGKNRVLTR